MKTQEKCAPSSFSISYSKKWKRRKEFCINSPAHIGFKSAFFGLRIMSRLNSIRTDYAYATWPPLSESQKVNATSKLKTLPSQLPLCFGIFSKQSANKSLIYAHILGQPKPNIYFLIHLCQCDFDPSSFHSCPQLWTLVSNQDEQTNGYSELWLEWVKSSTKFGDLSIKMFNFVYQKY